MNENNANFTPAAPNFKTLVRMNFQGLTNFPYIEEDFDALTNYGLLSKVVEYLNEVISNNNEQNTLMTGLYNAYVSLQNYVNDYFDNLDVQEEINNKLDDMAQDGTLTLLIKNYIDPIYQSYENEINAIVTTQNQNISNMNTRISNLSSGSPLIAASVAGMTDTTRLYVNTSDGYVYYYDGSDWIQGWLYQAEQIEDKSIVPEKTNFLTLHEDNIFNIESVSKNGVSFIRDYKNQTISITGTSTGESRVLLLRKYLSAGTYGLKAFDYSGSKPTIYLYTDENYNNHSWFQTVGNLARASWGANFTVETAGYYCFVAYFANNDTFSYSGKLCLVPNKTYQQINEYVPLTYDIENFINQAAITGVNTLNNFTNIDYWKNKKCLLYGDSLTAWGSWGDYLEEQFGLDVTNKGYAGSTATYNPSGGTATNQQSGSNDTRLAGLTDNNDLIVVMFGTNDYLNNFDLGDVPKTFNVNDTFDNTNFAGAMLKIIHYLYTNNPNARIILMCPPWNHYQTIHNKTLRDFGDIIKEIGRLTTTPVIDLFAKMNANALNYTEYYNDAGTHFNNDGYMRVASLLKEEIEELTPIYTE